MMRHTDHRMSQTQVFRSVVCFRHFTKNVSAIFNAFCQPWRVEVELCSEILFERLHHSLPEQLLYLWTDMSKIQPIRLVGCSEICSWKAEGLVAHTSPSSKSSTSSAPAPVQLQLFGQVKLAKIQPRALENCWYHVLLGSFACYLGM